MQEQLAASCNEQTQGKKGIYSWCLSWAFHIFFQNIKPSKSPISQVKTPEMASQMPKEIIFGNRYVWVRLCIWILALNFEENLREIGEILHIGWKILKPIFHCDAKLALGTFASPNAKKSTFASPDAKIPTCWYLLRYVTQVSCTFLFFLRRFYSRWVANADLISSGI